MISAASSGVVVAQFFMMQSMFKPSAPQPGGASVSQRESAAAEDNGLAIIDTLEKMGILSEKEADHIRERRAADEGPRFGSPPGSGQTQKTSDQR